MDASAPPPRRTIWTRSGPLTSTLPPEQVERLSWRTQVTFGDSATLGLWVFGTGAWLTGLVEAHVFPPAAFTALVPVLLVNSGLAQFTSGIMTFRRANTVIGGLLCSFGSLNATRGTLLLFEAVGLLHGGSYVDQIQGCLAEAYAWFALSLTLAALRMNAVMFGLSACTFIGFALSGIPYLLLSHGTTGPGIVGQIGGWFLVATAVFAYYGGMAMTVNTAWRRTVLPVGGAP